jgi:transglutaminase-like putative cysteine protease
LGLAAGVAGSAVFAPLAVTVVLDRSAAHGLCASPGRHNHTVPAASADDVGADDEGAGDEGADDDTAVDDGAGDDVAARPELLAVHAVASSTHPIASRVSTTKVRRSAGDRLRLRQQPVHGVHARDIHVIRLGHTLVDHAVGHRSDQRCGRTELPSERVERCRTVGARERAKGFQDFFFEVHHEADSSPVNATLTLDTPQVNKTRHVSAHLVLDVHDEIRAYVQVAVSGSPSGRLAETLQITSGGRPVEVTELLTPEGRVHVIHPPKGRLEIDYRASLHGPVEPVAVTQADAITFLRPSRYAESDRLLPTAEAEFAGIVGAKELLAAVSSWVGARLSYVPGSSGPTDGAVDTLLLRNGVCRDYAHLVVALLRALDVPARLVAVYAPGLDPMDFHAVAEAAVDGVWRVVDATLLAPRSSLVRIATGRDAADTAFLSTYAGAADLLESQVSAVIDGDLPADDVLELVSIG